jgi:AraC-like DNA-binding protein
LASCLLPKAKPAARRGDPRLAPMLRAQAISFIERNLHDLELDAGAVCRAIGMSRFVRAFWRRRAAHPGAASRRRHASLARAGRPRERVAEIAYGLGFSTESVFSRAFKDRFGCAPSEAREAAEPPIAKTVGGAESIGTACEAKVQSLPA